METINDIVAEMRIGDLCAEDTSASRPEYINDFLASYADRIEAAAKREREAGAEAAQICGEIGEIVGREATTDESSAVGKVDTVREVAQEMLNTSMQAVTAERINGWAMRLAEACEQSVTDCNRLNNAAAMREALEQIHELLSIGGNPDTAMCIRYEAAYQMAKEALYAPLRNCDVGTLHEQAERFHAFCKSNKQPGDVYSCDRCKLNSIEDCELAWAQMTYEKGGAK